MVARLVVPIALAGALILSLNLGVRQSFALFLDPITQSNGWSTSSFALAIAIQNLLWGLFTPLAGGLADRFGVFKVLIFGGLTYVAGTLVMALATTELGFIGGAGILIGLGTGATGFPLVLAAVGKIVSEKNRPLIMGIVTAGGSFGQIVLPPLAQGLIEWFDWQSALYVLAAIALIFLPLAIVLRLGTGEDSHAGPTQSLSSALREASGHSGFWLLNAGFFVCGFHVVYIGTYLPAFLGTCGLTPMVGATALSVIGVFNLIGTFGAGALGTRFRMKYLLSGIYFLRAAVIAVFIFLPVTEVSVLIFSGAFGLLWLSTVPLTSGIVARVFGPRYVATLFGIVMMSHQVGAFFGAYLGGYIFDLTGSYDGAWIVSIALGLFAGIIHLPIKDAILRPTQVSPAT